MSASTPWRRYTTRKREGFCYWKEGEALFVGAGNNPSASTSCRLNMVTGRILTWPGTADRPHATSPYSLDLPLWRGKGIPVVRMHPFGLLHLLVTGQAPDHQLMVAARTVGGRGAYYYSMPLTVSCILLSMLGVDRAVLAFDTTYDLDIRRYGE